MARFKKRATMKKIRRGNPSKKKNTARKYYIGGSAY